MAMSAPCKNCAERYVSCHISCEKYGNWKKELDVEKKKISDAKYYSLSIDKIQKEKSKRLKKYKKY